MQPAEPTDFYFFQGRAVSTVDFYPKKLTSGNRSNEVCPSFEPFRCVRLALIFPTFAAIFGRHIFFLAFIIHVGSRIQSLTVNNSTVFQPVPIR